MRFLHTVVSMVASFPELRSLFVEDQISKTAAMAERESSEGIWTGNKLRRYLICSAVDTRYIMNLQMLSRSRKSVECLGSTTFVFGEAVTHRFCADDNFLFQGGSSEVGGES